MAEQSRNEEILRSIIDETEYDKTPQSREEELLLELKQAIEGGGSSVVPNPEGEATETLNKLGIDDTVYGIPKELPAVTSADAGNVLGVNSEGQWTKMAANNNIIVFNASSTFYSGTGGLKLTLLNAATVGNIKVAFRDGKLPIIKSEDMFYFPKSIGTKSSDKVYFYHVAPTTDLTSIDLASVSAQDNTSTELAGSYKNYILP